MGIIVDGIFLRDFPENIALFGLVLVSHDDPCRKILDCLLLLLNTGWFHLARIDPFLVAKRYCFADFNLANLCKSSP